MEARPSRKTLLLAGLVLLGAILRIWNLGAESLWQDESWTWGLIQGNPRDLIHRLIHFDAHPPFYFLLVQAWSIFGMSDTWIRLLSAVFGVASLPAMNRLVSRMGGSTAGLVATALLTVSPYHVYYSREARSYALLFLLCIVSLDLLLDLLASPSRKKWIAFAVVTTLLPLTHYMGAFFIAAEVAAVGLLHRERPGFLKEFILASAGAFALFLPWLPTAFLHVTTVGAGFWLSFPTLSGLTFSMCSLVVSPFFMGNLGYWLAAGFYGLALGSVRRPREIALAAVLILPPAGELLVSLQRPLFYTQTFQYILIPLFALCAIGLARLPGPRCIMALALLLAAMIPGLVRTETLRAKEDWRGAVAWIDASIGAGDRVVVQPGFSGIGIERYAGTSKWMGQVRLVDGGDMFHQGVPRSVLREELRTIPGDVWLIFRYGQDEGWFESLGTEFQRIDSFSSRGVDAHRFRRK
jgi:4-amino-4-deoxy-L-arabinose transferase-like glycosyltransferase